MGSALCENVKQNTDKEKKSRCQYNDSGPGKEGGQAEAEKRYAKQDYTPRAEEGALRT